jgi:hypothetical protein
LRPVDDPAWMFEGAQAVVPGHAEPGEPPGSVPKGCWLIPLTEPERRSCVLPPANAVR